MAAAPLWAVSPENTSSSLPCPGTLPLTANDSDSDNDLESVRWYVDDVLITAVTTSIPMTQAHTLRAVARDARGATTTKTKTVTCLPV